MKKKKTVDDKDADMQRLILHGLMGGGTFRTLTAEEVSVAIKNRAGK